MGLFTAAVTRRDSCAISGQSVSQVSRAVRGTGYVFTAAVTRCDSSAISGQSAYWMFGINVSI